MSLLGFPMVRYIDIDDAEAVMRASEMTDPEMPLVRIPSQQSPLSSR
jgi:Serine dehydrogenase proteinase